MSGYMGPPRVPKDPYGPICAQVGRKWAQSGHKVSPSGSKWAQVGPKWAQREPGGVKVGPSGRKRAPVGPRRPQERPQRRNLKSRSCDNNTQSRKLMDVPYRIIGFISDNKIS